MKLAVIYDTKTGTTKQAAEWIAEGMQKVSGVEAEAFNIEAVDEEYVKASKGVVIGCPTYAALMTPGMRTDATSTASIGGFAPLMGSPCLFSP